MSMDVAKTGPVKPEAVDGDGPGTKASAHTWLHDPQLRLALLAGCLTLLVAVPTTVYRISEAGYLINVSGVWAALADDLRHGVLYRPIMSPLGYGGTRYFPLHIALHGALAWLGVPLVVGGHLISLLAGTALVAGAYLAFRSAGASSRLALCLAPVVLASRAVFMGLAGIRGDLLPVALAVLGLALVSKDDRRSPLAAGILIGLALLAKQTVAWAAAGAFIALWASGHRRKAIDFAVIVGGVGVLGLGIAYWASGGEMLNSFRAFSSGGGVASFKKLYKTLPYFRPGELLLIFGGFALCVAHWRESLKDPMRAAMFVVVPVTVLIFSSEGTHVNHLVDASVMGALVLALAFSTAQRWGRALLTLGLVGGLSEAFFLDGMELRRGELAAAAAAMPPGKDPVLADQPWIPLIAGERPFLLDSFNMAAPNTTGERMRRDLASKLDSCAFRAVVLSWRAELVKNPLFFKERFGPGFQKHLLDNYAISHVTGAHAFYLPRCGQRGTPAPLPAHLEETVGDRYARPGRLRALVQKLSSGG